MCAAPFTLLTSLSNSLEGPLGLPTLPGPETEPVPGGLISISHLRVGLKEIISNIKILKILCKRKIGELFFSLFAGKGIFQKTGDFSDLRYKAVCNRRRCCAMLSGFCFFAQEL